MEKWYESELTVEERYKNDLLNEIRKINQNMEKLISHIKPKVTPIRKPKAKKEPPKLRKKVQ